MKKKIIIISTALIGILILAYFIFFKAETEATKFSYTTISKGNLNVTISSSGTIQAVKTVEVGTQVSGKIDKLLVDFNSEVHKGQLLAVLDTIVLAASVKDAQASLDRAQAQYNQAIAVHERNKKLFEKNFMNEVDFISSKTNVESLTASLKSAKTALERAQMNLGYAYIYAPISGTIINRVVEQGQTVAASMSAPTIFTIAEDLSYMRILANVDESDIGQIKVGQKTKFTVQAFPNKSFEGIVDQIRLNPNTQSNVVNYVVVVKAENKDRVLLPGMTATIDFYVDYREDVLLVPNLALRFQPTEEMMASYRKEMEKEMANMPDSIKKRFGNMQQRGGTNGGGQGFAQGGGFPGGGFPMGGGMGFGGFGGGANGSASRRSRSGISRLWYFDENGKLKMSMVFTGLTDGRNTEIVRGRNIKEGMKIISGIVESSATATTTPTRSTNVLGGGAPGGMPGGGFGRGF